MDTTTLAAARQLRTTRIAELVWHLTEFDPSDTADVVEQLDCRITFSAEEAVTLAARALLALAATSPRPLRTPGYLRTHELVARPGVVVHHRSLRRWERSVPADTSAAAFVLAARQRA